MAFENFIQFILSGVIVGNFLVFATSLLNVNRIGEWLYDRSVRLVMSWFKLFGRGCMKKSRMSESWLEYDG